MKPFVKWIGGKRQLASQFQILYPNNFDTYIEPFVGAGAVFFDIIQKYEPKKVILNDLNNDLINTYNDIKLSCDNLTRELQNVQDRYNNSKDKEQFFKDSREEYNKNRSSVLFIFLNKTAFNGMYRINKSGRFNTPYNRTFTNLKFDFENIKSVSEIIKDVEIISKDYREVDYTGDNVFVYLDPPYRVITNNFTTYTKEGFNEQAQIKLSEFVKKLSDKGVKIMLSNSYNDDGFFEKYYKGFNFHFVNARRSVNSDGKGRGKVKEIVITNY